VVLGPLTVFEQSLQTEEWKDQRAAEGRTPDEIRSVRTAAVLIVLNAVLSVLLQLVAGTRLQVVPFAVALFIGYYLYKLRPRAENLAIGISLLGSTLLPAVYFWRLPLAGAVLQALLVWGTAGAVLLLLLGRAGPVRRRAALTLFVVLTLVVYCLAFALLFARNY
jgi:hypothetical protein